MHVEVRVHIGFQYNIRVPSRHLGCRVFEFLRRVASSLPCTGHFLANSVLLLRSVLALSHIHTLGVNFSQHPTFEAQLSWRPFRRVTSMNAFLWRRCLSSPDHWSASLPAYAAMWYATTAPFPARYWGIGDCLCLCSLVAVTCSGSNNHGGRASVAGARVSTHARHLH